MVLRLFGALAILFGGVIANLVSREAVFLIQAVFMLLFAIVFLFTLENLQEIKKPNTTFKDFGQMLLEGFKIMGCSKTMFFLFLPTFLQLWLILFG